jgi:sporulation protein YlmC with PRC-barrel domain
MFSLYKNMKEPKCGTILLVGVSILTISLASGSVAAVSERTSNQNDVPQYSKEEVKEGLSKAEDTVSGTVEDVSEAVEKTYQNIKNAFSDDDKAVSKPVKINMRMTASGMIGKPVHNEAGERVAIVRDIILSKDGAATMVVLGDGDWLGLGKLAAFDYSVVTKTNNDGDIIAPLSEAMIDNSAPFSYLPSEGDSNVRMVPDNGYSVSALLDSELVDSQGQRVAEVENISFKNGQADWLVVSFNQILGLGGEKAVMNFDDPSLINSNNKGESYFKLSASQSKKFVAFKKTTTN